MKWLDLPFFQSDEWLEIQKKMERLGNALVPTNGRVFRAFDETPYEKARVALIGQDPYPNPGHASGVAFEVARLQFNFPPTFLNIMAEYQNDLHYPFPSSGVLKKWTGQGVLLWNAIPTCTEWKSMSHSLWGWQALTQEVLAHLTKKTSVVVLMGGVAREFEHWVDQSNAELIVTSHPSPRGSANSKTPFKGSRIFSRINDALTTMGEKPIDWRLL